MLIAIVSDIHSNLVALEAVLETLPVYDQLWCLGDTIGYGPQPNECLAYMQGLASAALTGNHDLGCLGTISLADFNDVARISNEWNGRQLKPELRTFLQGLPATLKVTPEATLAHASPRDPIWEYVDTAAIAGANFAHFESQVCLVGHTHVPMCFSRRDSGQVQFGHMQRGEVVHLRPDTRYLLNPGSVGQPRDGDARAAYAIWDTTAGTILFERVGYDIGATQKQILAAGLPEPLAERLASGQ